MCSSDLFVLNSSGGISGSAFWTSPTAYDTVNRPWYIKANGWDQYTSFSGTGYEYSFSVSFTGGVLAGVREPLEPCNACLTHSFARAAPSLFVADPSLHIGVGVTTPQGVEDVTKLLVAFVKKMPDFPDQFRNFYFGTDDGSYYSIYNCKWPDYVPICTGAGPGGSNLTWFANIKNVNVPGYSTDGRRDRRALDNNGAITGVMTGSSSVFDTVNRPWFLQRNGWTQPFTGATAGSMNRGYAAEFTGGVVVSDVAVPCTISVCEPIYVPVPDSTQTIVPSVLLMLACWLKVMLNGQ